jgi:hypothetical protein
MRHALTCGPFAVVARDGIPLNNQEERGGGGLTLLVDMSP